MTTLPHSVALPISFERAVPAGDINRQQQRRRSTALSSKREQCHVDS